LAKGLKVGDRVIHEFYGEGAIVRLIGSNNRGNIFSVLFDGDDSPTSQHEDNLQKVRKEDFYAHLEIRNPRSLYDQAISYQINNAKALREQLESIGIGAIFNIKGLGEFVVYRVEPFEYPMPSFTYVEIGFIVAPITRPENPINYTELRRRFREKRKWKQGENHDNHSF